MATKMRDDLPGVVWVWHNGQNLMLQAGDEVPEGVEVAEALTVSDPPPKPRTRRRAPRKKTEEEAPSVGDGR